MLEQRVHILDLQVQEGRARYAPIEILRREENNRKLHDTMLSALKPQNDNKVAREIEVVTEAHRREMDALRAEHQESFKRIEEQVREARELTNTKQNAIRELQAQCQSKDDRLAAAEKEWADRFKKLEEEHAREVGKLRSESASLAGETERLRAESTTKLELAKKRYEEALNTLRGQLEDLTTRAEIPCYLTELNRVRADFDEYKEKCTERIGQLTKQRDEALVAAAQKDKGGNCRTSPKGKLDRPRCSACELPFPAAALQSQKMGKRSMSSIRLVL